MTRSDDGLVIQICGRIDRALLWAASREDQRHGDPPLMGRALLLAADTVRIAIISSLNAIAERINDINEQLDRLDDIDNRLDRIEEKLREIEDRQEPGNGRRY